MEKEEENKQEQTQNEECCCDCEKEECLKKEDNKSSDKELEKEAAELRNKVSFLETEIEKLKKEENKKILDFVEKKSKEASEIIQRKEVELTEKYKTECETKLKYHYSSQLSDLVEIVSQFEVVINGVTDPSVANYLVGFNMFLSQFDSLLKSLSITTISPKVGDEFNSDTMEATSTKKVDEEDMNNKITSVFKKGYMLHERIIKLASVEVGQIEAKE
ncbi:protein GrpE [Candidatus Mycoplasma haematohominis]|uniref:Protein GrpE n=1 Tax=Candidatus Mycoplasma haematohominis TaxID=1494318 RepID=A0A478FPD6_9MOLU|nr:protein GrpE [Candidatus Mycoplasma haemohominis]